MSLNAAALEVLVAKGLSASDILDIARALETAPSRTSNAERQKRYRDKKRNAERNERDVTDNVTLPPNDIYSNPPEPQIAKAISSPLAETAERVVEAWNRDTAGTPLPQTRGLNPDRRKHLAARIKEHGEDAVYLAIRGMAGSPWHSGKSGDWTNGNLGWLLKSPENFQKMLDLAPAAKAAAPAKTPEEWREYCLSTAEHFEGRGNMHDAEEWRRKAGVRPDRPPGFARPIGDLIPAMARG